jgi:hypothetical protein
MHVRRLLTAVVTVATTATLLAVAAPPGHALPQAACSQWRTTSTHDDKTHSTTVYHYCVEWVPGGDPDAWHEVPDKELADPPEGPDHGQKPDQGRKEHCALVAQELDVARTMLETAIKERDAAEADLDLQNVKATAAYYRYQEALARSKEEAAQFQYVLGRYFEANPDLHLEISRRDGSYPIIATEINLFRDWGETAYVGSQQSTRSTQEMLAAWREWSETADPERRAAQWRFDRIDETIAKTPALIALLEEEARRSKC